MAIRKCSTPFCKRRLKRGENTCSSCRSRKCRKSNPMRYCYSNLKSSAAKRDIFFDLTFEEFEEFAYECDYINRRGRLSKCMTVDRVQVGKYPGYTKSNIQPMTKGDNSRKRWLDYNYIDGSAKVHKISVPEPEGDLPF